MNSTSSNPSDAEAIRRLLAESGVADTQELTDALTALRAEARTPAPAPNAELQALFTPAATPLRKPSRRRGYLLGGAIIAAMAAGTTGVAATGGGLWITAEDARDAPAPVNYEQIPAPAPAPVSAETDPAELPPVLPAAPVQQAPEPAPAAATPAPAESAPAGAEPTPTPADEADAPGQWNNGSGTGGSERPDSGPDTNRGGKTETGQKDQHGTGGHSGKNDRDPGRDTGQSRGDTGRDSRDSRDGPQRGTGPGQGRSSG